MLCHDDIKLKIISKPEKFYWILVFRILVSSQFLFFIVTVLFLPLSPLFAASAAVVVVRPKTAFWSL